MAFILRWLCAFVNLLWKGIKTMNIISIEEIQTSNQLKKSKCDETKAAMKDILSEGQLKKFDGVFDGIVGKVFKGVMLKEKE